MARCRWCYAAPVDIKTGTFMAVTRKVEGWGTTTAARVVMDACDRVGVGLIMLSSIGIVVKSEPKELTG